MSKESERSSGGGEDRPAEPVQAVLNALERLKFGAIQLTVHEGKLVQVDITERKRFTS